MERMAEDLARVLGRDRVEVSAGGPPADQPTRPSARPFVDDLVAAMNRERAASGLGPLRLNAKLSAAAGDRIDDMFRKHYFDHVSPDGMQPFVWVARRGYDYSIVGENLAAGFPTAPAVVSGWMHSPGHRANILGRSFDEIGIAVADGSPLRPYSGPTVVAMYGAR